MSTCKIYGWRNHSANLRYHSTQYLYERPDGSRIVVDEVSSSPEQSSDDDRQMELLGEVTRFLSKIKLEPLPSQDTDSNGKLVEMLVTLTPMLKEMQLCDDSQEAPAVSFDWRVCCKPLAEVVMALLTLCLFVLAVAYFGLITRP